MTPSAPRPPLDTVLTRSVTLTDAPAPILAWAPAPPGLPTAPTNPPATPRGGTAPTTSVVAAHLTTALRPIDLSQVNWPLTYRLRTLVSERLSQRIDETTDDDARRQIGKMLIPDVLREHHDVAVRTGDTANQIPRALYEPHRKAVESAIFGYGRWQPLFEDADVENIEINSWRNTTMVYPDKIVSVPPVADHDGELIEQLVFMSTYSPTPRDFSPAHPEMTLNLEDRWRLHAKAFDTSLNGPSIVIRQHKFGATPLATLADWGMMPANLPPFLTAAVRARRSILVSGVGGVGKTSLVRSLFLALDPMLGVIVIESDAELFLHQVPGRTRTRSFIARSGSAEGIGVDGRPIGSYSVSEHFIGALRQNVAIVIVGEVRGPDEAVPMFQSMQQGAGSISTIHAHHAGATIERLVTAASQGGAMSSEDAYRQTATNLHLVIHLDADDQRSRGGVYRRYINQIMEIDGLADNGDGTTSSKPATNMIYDVSQPDRPLTATMSSQLREACFRQGWRGDL